jgi:tetratricopeptide (TPR) repeat protein
MRACHLIQIALLGWALLYAPLLTAESGTKDQDLFNQGKVLMFDKKWDDARAAFQMLLQEFPNSNFVPQANYFKARCLQAQGKDTEALRAYEFFLQKYAQESYLQTEARNAVVDLSAALLEKGDGSYKDRITGGLKDANKDVRYFSAIRASYLNDRKITTLAVPILREILEKEKERDLVDRAKIALLRIDPNALSAPHEPSEQKKSEGGIDSRGGINSRMFHIMVYEEGKSQPTVEVNLPLSFAQLAVMALDQSKKEELKKKGFNVDDFWESIKRLGPTKILEIRDGKDLVKIWIE